jgi:repressor LexA
MAVGGKSIQLARKHMKMTQSELAVRCGVSRKSIGNYESGMVPDIDVGLRIADVLGINLDDLYSANDSSRIVFVIEELTSETDILYPRKSFAIERIPANWDKDGIYFALRVNGDSMEPRFYDHDIVLCEYNPKIESDGFTVIGINGERANIRSITKVGDKCVISATNPIYKPELIDLAKVSIYGQVKELRARW